MTSPNNDQPKPPADQQQTRSLRAGQLVTFRHPDPLHSASGFVEGHGIVLTVSEDGGSATIAPLSLLHLVTAADNVTPAKAADVPTTIQQPETPAASS